jgi:AraC-like DNA-binding protein
MGPITLLDLSFGVDTWIRCIDQRSYYQVNILASGQMDLLHRGTSIACAAGSVTACVPEGDLAVSRWGAGTRMIAVRFDRSSLENVLSETLGYQTEAQIDFNLSMATTGGPARTWLRMFNVFAQELFLVDSALNQPLVALPYIDALTRGLLLAIDHPHRKMLAAERKYLAPRAIQAAIDLIEAEAHLPLTVSSLARCCNISSRALQQGFIRYMGMSPMAYLRQVRLRCAHQDLVAADPSMETVASVAKRWGYSNPGRFAAAHAERYGEMPAATLRGSRLTIPIRQSALVPPPFPVKPRSTKDQGDESLSA